MQEMSKETNQKANSDGETMVENDREYMAAIEAILFSMGDSVELGKLAQALQLTTAKTEKLIGKLQEEMKERGAGIRIVELDGSYQMCTCAEMFSYLVRIARQPRKYTLTDVMLETLSIIAYKQPVTKAEIDKIRGVSSDHAVNRLIEFGLVKELGRLDAPGRPILLGTTEEFLRCFGVTKIDELPVMNPVQLEEFRQEAEAEMNVKVEV